MKFLHTLSDVLPLVFWMLLLFGFDVPYIAVLTLISAFLHELGHLFFIRIYNVKRGKLKASVSGFRIHTAFTSYKEEALCAFGGPLVNLVIFLLLILISNFFSAKDYIITFAMVNLLSALSNLLPIRSYDGYRIFHCILAYFCGSDTAERICYAVSFLLSTLLTFFSLYLLLKCGEGYWIFGIFFALLFTNITESHAKTKNEQ